MESNSSGSNSKEYFWGEIAPCEHSVQIYEDDEVFFSALSSFVAEGIKTGDGVIVIVTRDHLKILESRLAALAISVADAKKSGQFIPCDADEVLKEFLVEGWPDRELFESTVNNLLEKARGNQKQRRVRAFGELVALMWAKGYNGATVNLEHLWHSLCQSKDFSLFCAYPKAGFTEQAAESIRTICEVHTRVIGDGGICRSITDTPVEGAI